MIETTVRLIRSRGFHGTGLNAIIHESGAPKGSLYYHFPGGKDQLVTEAVNRAGEAIVARIQAAFDSTPSPLEAVKAIVELTARELQDSQFKSGCPIATVALEVGGTESPVRDACEKALLDSQDVLFRNLSAAGLPADRAQALAELMVTTYEGALLIGRAHRSTLPLTNLLKSLPLLLPA